MVVLNEYTAKDPHWLGLDSSRARLERAEAFAVGGRVRERTYQSSWPLIRTGLTAAAETMDLLGQGLTRPAPSQTACATLARASVETLARAAWLASPGIGWRRRMARALLERWASSREADDAEANLDAPAGSLGEMPSVVVAHIEAVGFEYGPGLVIENERRPSDRAVVRDVLRGKYEPSARDSVMNYLSGHAHGMLWAILQSFAPTGGVVEDEPEL